MASYFTTPAGKKRKRAETIENPKKRFVTTKSAAKPVRESKSSRGAQRDESISGSEDESDDEGPHLMHDDAASLSSGSSEGEEASDTEETAAERRLRLAERYLENIRTEVDNHGFDAEEIDRDLIAERLVEDAAESKGHMYRQLARALDIENAEKTWWGWNSQSVTSIAACAPWVYTVGKDISLAKWRIQELPEEQWVQKGKKKQKKPPPPPKRRPIQIAFVKGDKREAKNNSYQGHTDSILAVAASQDGKFVVTGGRDNRIVVWDAKTLMPLRVFNQHRDSVTSLAFRRGTNQMYSSSKDRVVKVWSLDELAYVDTLFGHQDEVLDVAALAQERCISVGARDRTARYWKVAEDTQLVFRGGGGERKKSSSDKPRVMEGSIDRVAMIDEEMFVTGGDSGNLSLWTIHKKKPVFTISHCHGIDPALHPEDASAETDPDPASIPEPQPRWITALATIPYSDVILSGSWDGQVRVWRVSDDKKKLEAVGGIGPSGIARHVTNGDSLTNGHIVNNGNESVRGIVNDISVFERGERGKDGVCVVVAVGKEHRLGRWQTKKGKNGGVVFEIARRQMFEENKTDFDENSV